MSHENDFGAPGVGRPMRRIVLRSAAMRNQAPCNEARCNTDYWEGRWRNWYGRTEESARTKM